MKSRLLITLLTLFIAATALAHVETKEIEYREGDTVMKGFLAWNNDMTEPQPGILVVHEWWGHNEFARDRARKLAAMGYTALAVDMYGEGKQVDHPADAGKFSGELAKNVDLAEARFQAGLTFLKEQPQTDAEKISAIGYCFGGGMVLHMARTGMDLDAVVSFHGSLGALTTATPGSVKAKILVCTGAEDPFIPAEQIEGFKTEMDALKADYEVMVLEGAQHSFTNPDADEFGKKFELPLQYNKAADEKSWEAMKALFHQLY